MSIYSKRVISSEEISFSKIREKYSEEYLYSIYLGYYPETKKMYYSPFQKEKVPSFNFYIKEGKLLFKDYSTTITGDIVNLVENMYSLNYTKAVQKIYSDCNGYIEPIKRVYVNTEVSYPAKIEVITKSYTQEDFDYWEQYYIDLKILEKYNIKPCKEVWCNVGKGEFLWYNYTDKNPCYRYLFNGKYKCYKPLDKSSNNKWLNNCNNLNNIQGLEHIFKSDYIIITKSYKDIICFNEFIGIPAISFHGEGHYIDQKIIDWLKSKYKKIIIFYDNDTAGISQGFKVSRLYDLPYTYIPSNYKEKDLSDFIKSYGIEESKKLINELLK